MKVRLVFNSRSDGRMEKIVEAPDDAPINFADKLFPEVFGVPFMGDDTYFQILDESEETIHEATERND